MDKLRTQYLSSWHTNTQSTRRRAQASSEDAGQPNPVDTLVKTSMEGMKYRRAEKGKGLRGSVKRPKYPL